MSNSTPGGEDSPRPKRVQVGSVIAYPRRAPLAEDGRWYWQVVRHMDDGQKTVEGASGRYTAEEVFKHLSKLASEHGWNVPTKRPPAPTRPSTLEGLLLEWLTEQEVRMLERRTIAKGTYTASLTAVKAWIKVGGKRHPSELLTRANLQQLVDTLAQSYAPRTIRTHTSKLAEAWTWCREERLVDGWLPRVEKPKVRRDEYCVSRYTPGAAEVWKMAAKLPGDWQYIAVALLLATGARLGEIADLDWADVDLVLGEVRVAGKTGARSIPLPPWAVLLLRQWMARSSGKGPVTGAMHNTLGGSLGRYMNEAAAAAAVTPFTPHALRRRMSWRLIERGIDPATYQEIMGHTLDEGLRDYARSTPQARRAALAADETPPTTPDDGPLYAGPVH